MRFSCIGNKIFCRKTELLLLLLLAAFLRLWHIGKPDIGGDECFSLFYSQLSVTEIINFVFQGDNPPLWETLVHFWIMIFGVNALSIRLFSAIFNILTIIPIYYIGEKFVKSYTGFFAALFYAFSSFSIFLAHDGRVYSLVGFLSATSIYLFLSLMENGKTSRFILLTAVNILIMYSHYLAVWLIVMEFLIFVSVPNVRKALGKGYFWHILSLFIAYLPVFPFLYARFLDSGMHGTWIAKCESGSDLYNMFLCFTNTPVPTACALVILIAGFAKRVYRLIKKDYFIGYQTVINLIWIIPIIVSFLVSFKIGFFFNRYFYFLLPAYLLGLSSAFLYLFDNKRIPIISLYAVFTVMIIVSCKTDSTEMRYGGWKGEYAKAIAAMLELKNSEHATVIIAPDWLDKQIVYYLDENHSAFKTEGNPYQKPVFASYLQQNGYCFQNNYKEYITDNQCVICIHNDFYDIQEIKDFLNENGYEESECRAFKQMAVSLFRRR